MASEEGQAEAAVASGAAAPAPSTSRSEEILAGFQVYPFVIYD